MAQSTTVRLQAPVGVTQIYGVLDSGLLTPGLVPAIYRPDANHIVELPRALVVPDLLAQGYVIVDGSAAPGPVRGWSFRDLPFLRWAGNWFGSW